MPPAPPDRRRRPAPRRGVRRLSGCARTHAWENNRIMHVQPLPYLDPVFLESEEARPLRILAEYLEPLARFKAQNIQDTVVFFGSARIHSREHAEQALEVLLKRHGVRAGAEVEAHLARGRK